MRTVVLQPHSISHMFILFSSPCTPADGLLDDIQAVAKAEVQPVVVDEDSGSCSHVPHGFIISGSLSNGWTYDAHNGYFPLRFVNKSG